MAESEPNTAIDDLERTFFLDYNGETKKVQIHLAAPIDLPKLFKGKFTENELIQSLPSQAVSFQTKDQEYGVVHKVEDATTQIYDGAVLEVKISQEHLPGADISRELEEMKRKINKLESKEEERTTKKRRVDSGERFVVRIRGLPWEATISDIREFFKDQHLVDEGVTMVTNNQGRATGEAFVELASKEDLDGALKKDRQHMGHRYIEVYRSTAGEADRARGGQGAIGYATVPRRVPVNDSSSVVRMRGLPFAATEADIYNFFDKLHCVAVHLPKDHLGRPSGDAFVEFASEMEVSEALEYNKKHMGHRYVELFRSNISELCHAMGVNTRTGNVAADTDKCLRMQGLPWNCVESDITRFFQEAQVTPTHIHRKSDGGEAYCEFASVEDANRAMGRHKAYIGRRYIELFRVSYVEMAKVVGLPIPPENAYGPPPYGGNFGPPAGRGTMPGGPPNAPVPPVGTSVFGPPQQPAGPPSSAPVGYNSGGPPGFGGPSSGGPPGFGPSAGGPPGFGPSAAGPPGFQQTYPEQHWRI